MERWTDDRLDDLHGMVKANDHRLDTVQDMAQTADRNIKELQLQKITSFSNRMQWLMFMATLASPILTVVIVLWRT